MSKAVVSTLEQTASRRFWTARTIAKHKVASLTWSLVRGILITGICFMIIYPILIKISTSLKGLSDLYDYSVVFIPRDLNIEGYRIAWRFMNYPKYLVNTIALSLGVSVLQLISCTLIGYGLARFQFVGNNLLFALVILVLVIPPPNDHDSGIFEFPVFRPIWIAGRAYKLVRNILAFLSHLGYRYGFKERAVHLYNSSVFSRNV